ncbi:MAG: hypothetical protein EOP05_18275 [Proteobacteria bacterium]|nr:MAG: hypothetical protein EOP05_18275 [Pseudomonadota bacterium]
MKTVLNFSSKLAPNFFLAMAVILMAAQAFAAAPVSSETPTLECANQAVEAAVSHNFKRFGASTNSCGAKLLTAGDYLETYLVCVSDENEPSEWVVAVRKTITNKKNEVVGKCGVKFADAQYDSGTPNFNDGDTDLIPTWACTADYGGDGKVHCK